MKITAYFILFILLSLKHLNAQYSTKEFDQILNNDSLNNSKKEIQFKDLIETHLRNKEFDTLFKKAKDMQDGPVRTAIYEKLNRIAAEYTDKISKAQSDKFTAQSGEFETQAQVAKLENDFSNYEIRNSMMYVRAPQDGNINKAVKSGIGETFKEGEGLVTVMPSNYDFAVETFIDPIDIPLVHVGEKVRVQFDGWPAIIFRGWPNLSYGTYGGTVVAIENFISENGKFRVLISPDKDDHPWPKAIKVGSGAYAIALLEDVPIWFEIWRKLNGFPPNYYQPTTAKSEKTASKV